MRKWVSSIKNDELVLMHIWVFAVQCTYTLTTRPEALYI